MSSIPRYLPDDPWPAYAYRPGRDPHPTRDPRGHSYDTVEDVRAAEPAARWQDSARYLRGVDLFNHGYGWEAHEAWESLWLRPEEAKQAECLQALIQLAAATVQEGIGHADGRVRLCHRALAHLQHVHKPGQPVYMGLRLDVIEDAIEVYAKDSAQRPVLRLESGPLQQRSS